MLIARNQQKTEKHAPKDKQVVFSGRRPDANSGCQEKKKELQTCEISRQLTTNEDKKKTDITSN